MLIWPSIVVVGKFFYIFVTNLTDTTWNHFLNLSLKWIL